MKLINDNLKISAAILSALTLAACNSNSVSSSSSSSDNSGSTTISDTPNLSESQTTTTHSSFINLEEASSYNLFLFGDLYQPSADTEGSIAVGGNAALANYSVGDKLPRNASRSDLVVAGNLIFKSGAISNGSLVVGGNIDLGSVSVAGKIKNHRPAIDFKKTKKILTQESLRLSQLPQTATPIFENWGQPRGRLTLSGTNSHLNVFNITADMLGSTYELVLNIPTSSQAIINISGTDVKIQNMSMNLNSTDRSDLVFNAAQCNHLMISGVSVEGSIFAPNANIDFPAGVVRGQIVAQSLRGRGQINHNPIHQQPPQQGPQTPPEVPEIPYE